MELEMAHLTVNLQGSRKASQMDWALVAPMAVPMVQHSGCQMVPLKETMSEL